MAKKRSLKELTELFRKLGASDPEQWAESQIEEGIPQLQRFLFLRQAWKTVIGDDDVSWIDKAIAEFEEDPSAPYADVGRVVQACLSKGISKEDLTALARCLQAANLFNLTYLLGDPGELELEVKDTMWALVSVDPKGNAEVLDGLHESVLETDPTGREMRPKK